MHLLRGGILATSFVLLFLWAPKVQATCVSSVGGDGSVWLTGTITAGGSPAAGIGVTIESSQWGSTDSYHGYERACTDANGQFFFRVESNAAANCTYPDSPSSCNRRSFHCDQYCHENDAVAGYRTAAFSLTGYKIRATPEWGSELAGSYSSCESSELTVNLNSSQTVNCALSPRDKTIRVSVVDELGRAVTSGLNISVNGASYATQELAASSLDFAVSQGTYSVNASCRDWSHCTYPCVSSSNVVIAADSTVTQVTLTAQSSSATVSGLVSGSDGVSLGGVYINMSSYSMMGGTSGASSCPAHGEATTASDGSYSLNILPGTYTMWYSPPSGTGGGASSSPYAGLEATVTLVAFESLTKNATLVRKDSSISGRVVDSDGDGIAGVWVNAWTYDDEVHDWASDETESDGSFVLPAIAGAKYNIDAWFGHATQPDSAFSELANCSNEGMQTKTAPQEDVIFTFNRLSNTVNFQLVNSEGATLSTYVYANIRLSTAENDMSSYHMCGGSLFFEGGRASKKLAANSSYILEANTGGAADYDPQSTQVTFDTGESGTTSVVEIVMIPVDATITGQYIDEEDKLLTPESRFIEVQASRGGLWRSCTSSSSSFTCNVSAGRWCLGYWVDWNSPYTSTSPAASASCLTIPAGGNVSHNLLLLRTGTIRVKVLGKDNSPKKWVRVNASPTSASQQGADESTRHYWNNGCFTDDTGECEIRLGAASGGTTYYLNAYRPWGEMKSENITLPEEVSVVTLPGDTVIAPTLVFRELDGELSVTVTLSDEADTNASSSDVVSSAFVSCFSELAGYAEATTDTSGLATVKCASGDDWSCVAINQLNNELFISEMEEISCVPVADHGATLLTLKLNDAGTIPDAVSQNWDAGSAHTVGLPDGASVYFPGRCLGDVEETVSCTVQPDPILPYHASARPTCFYGYDITCRSSTGAALTQLTSEATICLPLCDEQLSLLDLTGSDVRLAFRDTATDAYLNLENVTVDDENDLVCGQTNHLTEFTLIGPGAIQGVDGDSEDALEEQERTGEESGVTTGASSGCGCNFTASSGSSRDQLLSLFLGLSLLILLRVSFKKIFTS